MFIKGNCAIYIDKNLKVYENNTVLFVLWSELTWGNNLCSSKTNKDNFTKLYMQLHW